MERTGLVIVVSVCLLGTALWLPEARGADVEPAWAVVSTEVDETLDGSGFMDRQGLGLYPPDFEWSGNLGDVLFDTGDILGVEAGLDALHYMTTDIGPGGQILDPLPTVFFSLEVDVTVENGGPQLNNLTEFEDEDLFGWNPTWGVYEVFDGEDLFGFDFGLDAVSQAGNSWFISTEVGGQVYVEPVIIIGSDGQARSVAGYVPFSDGDLIGTSLQMPKGVLDMSLVFGRNVGLDALHIVADPDNPDQGVIVYLSTEVDGFIPFGDNPEDFPKFKDEDIIKLTYGEEGLADAEVVWRGEEGFGRDVGLDALYLEIPEPGTLFMAGLGLSALVIRLRKKK